MTGFLRVWEKPIAPPRTCQWIEGERSRDDRCKCLAPTVPGMSYCPPHLARTIQEDG